LEICDFYYLQVLRYSVTKENRAVDKMCPECKNNPIIEADDSAFCDICNRYLESALLVS
jgi:phosphoribosylformylglycinamidine (FGAM) synthase PurS component